MWHLFSPERVGEPVAQSQMDKRRDLPALSTLSRIERGFRLRPGFKSYFDGKRAKILS
jgi:hypothetical protein